MVQNLQQHCYDIQPLPNKIYGNEIPLLRKAFQPFPKQLILDSSNLREFADKNFKFGENGRKFSKQVEKE